MPEEAERLGFLSRWSRRKRGEEVPEPEAPPTVEAASPAPEPLEEAPPPEAPPEPEFDVSTLPPIETLDASSDFTVFLKPGVPAELRLAALRKAWIADPLIRDYMSPLDYAWDFNTPGGLPHGFSNVLAETGEALRKLFNQAIGEMEPEEEKTAEGVALAEAPALPPSEAEAEPQPGPEHAEAPSCPHDSEDMSPPSPIRLSEASSPALAPLVEDRPPPVRRRHGGAMPA
jgi:hypothetical protein